MSTSTLETPTTTHSAASAITAPLMTLQQPFPEAFTIPVIITDGTTSAAKVCVPQELKYASVAEDFDGTITWDLDVPTGVIAKFDDPPIQFYGGDPFPVTRVSDTRATIGWANPAGANRGKSFNYRLNVRFIINDLVVLVSHDPTMHNEPPT